MGLFQRVLADPFTVMALVSSQSSLLGIRFRGGNLGPSLLWGFRSLPIISSECGLLVYDSGCGFLGLGRLWLRCENLSSGPEGSYSDCSCREYIARYRMFLSRAADIPLCFCGPSMASP